MSISRIMEASARNKEAEADVLATKTAFLEQQGHKARADASTALLANLAEWAACAIEPSSISTETYWRELPKAIAAARAFLDNPNG